MNTPTYSYHFPIGSYVLGLASPQSDSDFINFDSKCCKIHFKTFLDNHKFSDEELHDALTYKVIKMHGLFNYQCDKDINPYAAELNYDIFDYKVQMLQVLKDFIKENETYLAYKLDKRWYHILYQYFLLKNNSKVLTEDQFKIVKNAHDRKLKKNILLIYIDEIKQFRI